MQTLGDNNPTLSQSLDHLSFPPRPPSLPPILPSIHHTSLMMTSPSPCYHSDRPLVQSRGRPQSLENPSYDSRYKSHPLAHSPLTISLTPLAHSPLTISLTHDLPLPYQSPNFSPPNFPTPLLVSRYPITRSSQERWCVFLAQPQAWAHGGRRRPLISHLFPHRMDSPTRER